MFFPNLLLVFSEDLNVHEYLGLAFWNAGKNGDRVITILTAVILQMSVSVLPW